ncbi:3-dehydro-L-gulonate 2-dehydrogenase [Ningiella sp. W23]|uniref:3-dehydro-L-gulonate 2-dehydrogenase n=1 Tax=Ningiella sp. W23 TaxID=3023715 RepID=UPI003756CD51
MTTLRISPTDMLDTLTKLFVDRGYQQSEAAKLSEVFTENSCCGVQSHGINRVPLFIEFLDKDLVDIKSKASCVEAFGGIERWDGKQGAGILNALAATNRAIVLAKQHAMGMVALRNTNHWMRGGYYAWRAAQQGCIAIMFTNTKPNMPAWGGKELRIGNNPFVISIPNGDSPILLDMAMSQFSFGKMESYAQNNEQLPVEGGWDKTGALSKHPQDILETQQSLPIGYWKGSALAMVLDMLATLLCAGQSTYRLGQAPEETGVSQVFICIDQSQVANSDLHTQLLNEIISFTQSATEIEEGKRPRYPGEQSFACKKDSLKNGIPVDSEVWNTVLHLKKQ